MILKILGEEIESYSFIPNLKKRKSLEMPVFKNRIVMDYMKWNYDLSRKMQDNHEIPYLQDNDWLYLPQNVRVHKFLTFHVWKSINDVGW